MSQELMTDLIELARDPDPAARHKLSQRITAICLESPHELSPQEKEVAGHVLIQLSREFETKLRVLLAHQLASSNRAPKTLIQVLAADEIEVSAPIIGKSPLLEERDLIDTYRLGVNAYVVKPVDFADFMRAVKDLGVFWAVLNEPPPNGI